MVDQNGNLCTTVTGTIAFTGSPFGATFPTTGLAIGAKSGANMVNLTADGSSNLNVDCTVGCSGGAFSNSSDAVATSAINGQAAAWLYAFNGTTWDRLRDDANFSLQTVQWQGNAALSATNGTFANLLQGNAALSATNGLFANIMYGNAAISTSHAIPINIAVGGTVISGTNGIWSNLLQGNAVLSTSNPIFVTGTGTAGTAATNPITVQGIASMTPLLVTSAGTTSNASSAVATSATNQATVAYNYAFNGTTWDQIQDDANKNLKIVVFQGASALGATNGIYSNLLQGNAVLGVTNGLYSNLLQGNAVLSATNGLFSNLVIAGAVVSATNGEYNNLLQGNAVLSATNGLFTNLLQGNAVLSASNPLFVAGTAANGASVAGNPVQVGGRAQTAEITPVTNGQAVYTAMDSVGKQIIMPYANKENFVSGTATATTATNTSVIAAQASGIKIYLTGFSCYNSGATTSTLLFTSGSGGSTIWATILPAGGGSNGTISPPVPTAAATALFMTTGSSSTTMSCSATGYAGT
jgi:hypothetical protein